MLVSELQYKDYHTMLHALNNPSNVDEVFETIRQVRNVTVGSEKLRSACIEIGLVDKIVHILEDLKDNTELLILLFNTLSDFAHSPLYFNSDRDVRSVKVVFDLFETTDNLRLKEACARYCHSLTKFVVHDVVLSAKHVLVKIMDDSDHIFEQISLCIGYLVRFDPSNSQYLVDIGILSKIKVFLIHNRYLIKLLSLNLLRLISNASARAMVACLSEKVGDFTIQDVLLDYIRRTRRPLIRLLAAQILSNAVVIGVGLPKSTIEVKLLPALVNLACSAEDSYVIPHSLIVLAHIISICPNLQAIAMYCEEFPTILLAYLKLDAIPFYMNLPTEVTSIDFFFPFSMKFTIDGFHAIVLHCISALTCVEEQNRRIFSKNREFMIQLPKFASSKSRELVAAALVVAQMLSRSMHVLRSNFDDNEICSKALDMLAENLDTSILRVASALICNLMMILIPKQKLLVSKLTIPRLFELIFHADHVISTNCLWSLINASFHVDGNIQDAILQNFDRPKFADLTQKSNVLVRCKMFILLLNLSRCPSFEQFMRDHKEDFLKAATIAFNDNFNDSKRSILNLYTKLGSKETFLYLFTDDIINLIFYQLENHADTPLLYAALEVVRNVFHFEDDGSSSNVRNHFIDLGVAKTLSVLSRHANPYIRQLSDQILDSFEKED